MYNALDDNQLEPAESERVKLSPIYTPKSDQDRNSKVENDKIGQIVIDEESKGVQANHDDSISTDMIELIENIDMQLMNK